MIKNYNWIAISYTVPATPSKYRVYVWRKLKEMGAEPLNQGISLLPCNEENYAKLQALKNKIISLKADAKIIFLDFDDENDSNSLKEIFKKNTKEDYKSLITDCKNILKCIKNKTKQSSDIDKKIKEVNRSYKKVREKQFFPEELSKELESDITEIKNSMKDLKNDLKNLF